MKEEQQITHHYFGTKVTTDGQLVYNFVAANFTASTGDVSGDVTGFVSDISNDTGDLTEGPNLYLQTQEQTL